MRNASEFVILYVFVFNNNKSTTLKKHKTIKKLRKKNIKTCFLNFNKNIKKVLHLCFTQGLATLDKIKRPNDRCYL